MKDSMTRRSSCRTWTTVAMVLLAVLHYLVSGTECLELKTLVARRSTTPISRYTASGASRSSSNQHQLDRRTTIDASVRWVSFWVITGANSPPPAAGMPTLWSSPERRPLEVCLLAILRVTFWAESLANSLSTKSPTTTTTAEPPLFTESGGTDVLSERQIKSKYLEARLGAKAVLTGRTFSGDGASGRVYTLASLHVSDCLNDLQSYQPSIAPLKREYREALASLVEFDGMDSLIDASPRSSLTLSQYNEKKRDLVERILREQVVPLGQRIIHRFDPDAIDRSMSYIQTYYSNEIPFPESPTKENISSSAAVIPASLS